MGTVIHGRRKGKKCRYRIWSLTRERYETPELGEEEIRECFLQDALLDAVNQYVLCIEERMSRAAQRGTSETGAEPALSKPWKRGARADNTPLPKWFKARLRLSTFLNQAVNQFIENEKRKDPQWSLKKFVEQACPSTPLE